MSWRFFVLTIAVVATQTLADSLIYDASVKRIKPGSGGAAYYYNPGVDNAGQSGHILFDDVTVLSTFPVTKFQVTKVTVAVSRLPNAASVQITPYYSQLFPNTVGSGGPNDGPFSDPRYPQVFSTPVTLAANSTTFVDGATITFGDGTSTLFNVAGFPAGPTSSYRSFALGLNFSTTSDQNGWTLAQQPNNLNVDWDYLNDSNFAEFTFGVDSSGMIVATQYLKVEGSLIGGMLGDPNFDGRVDIEDARILAQHWNHPGNYLMGDFDFNGFVDVGDLYILAVNWQSGWASLSSDLALIGLPPNTMVPDPIAVNLLAIIVVVNLRRR